MLHRMSDTIQYECDGCEVILDTEQNTIVEANRIRSESNWMLKSEDGNHWAHYCSKCRVNHG